MMLMLRLIFVSGAATLAGVASLIVVQMMGVQVPDVLVGWLSGMLGLDGESAHDAAYLAFFLGCNLLGILAYVSWRVLA